MIPKAFCKSLALFSLGLAIFAMAGQVLSSSIWLPRPVSGILYFTLPIVSFVNSVVTYLLLRRQVEGVARAWVLSGLSVSAVLAGSVLLLVATTTPFIGASVAK